LDSLFCRKCAAAFTDLDRDSARTSNDALVAEGMVLFHEGKIDDAMAIGEHCVTVDPDSIAALSLKGVCLERVGKIGEALEAYERIVELKPDSALDRIKLNQIRNSLAAPLVTAPAKRNYIPAIGAAVSMLLVIVLGASFGFANRPQSVATQEDPRTQEKMVAFGVPGTSPGQSLNDNSRSNPQTNFQQNPPNNPNGVESPTNSGSNQQGLPVLPKPDGMAFQRPDNGGSSNMSVEPIRPNVPQSLQGSIGNSRPSSGDSLPGISNSDPSLSAAKPPDQATNPPKSDSSKVPAKEPAKDAPKEPEKNDGYIEIAPSNGGQRPGGSQSLDQNESIGLIRSGNAQFEMGQYASAILSYERALRRGGDPGRVNQRLAQSYERTGRFPEAARAYQRAIGAYELALKAGGDGEYLRGAIESCRAGPQRIAN